jgi:hypothetical protein
MKPAVVTNRSFAATRLLGAVLSAACLAAVIALAATSDAAWYCKLLGVGFTLLLFVYAAPAAWNAVWSVRLDSDGICARQLAARRHFAWGDVNEFWFGSKSTYLSPGIRLFNHKVMELHVNARRVVVVVVHDAEFEGLVRLCSSHSDRVVRES